MVPVHKLKFVNLYSTLNTYYANDSMSFNKQMYKSRGNVLRTSNREIEPRTPGFTLGSETNSHWSETLDKLRA
jgi:hypothetical protein